MWYREFQRGQLVPTAMSAEEASWGTWKQLDLWSVCLFYSIPSFSHCLKDSPSLCRHPQNLHSGDIHVSLLYAYSVHVTAVEGSPAPPFPSSAPSLDSLHSWSGKDGLCQSTMERRYRLAPSRCGGDGGQRHQPFQCSSAPGAAEAGGDAPHAAELCNSCFGWGKGALCCSEQLLNHPLPKPAVGPTVTPGASPVHVRAESPSHSCGLKVSTGDFNIRFKAGPHCQMFSKWLRSKLSLALIKPVDAVSFSKAHVYRDLLGT